MKVKNNMKCVKRLISAITLILLVVMCTEPLPAKAALQDENLIVKLPKEFRVGFQTKKNGMDMSEFVPKGETVNDWSSMITVQIFHEMKNSDPEKFAGNIGQQWTSFCADSAVQKIKSGMENGYPFALWMYTCPLNSETKKPENMVLKVISGNDAFYSVQYAYRNELDKDLVVSATQYLRSVMVCDTRVSDRACPKGM